MEEFHFNTIKSDLNRFQIIKNPDGTEIKLKISSLEGNCIFPLTQTQLMYAIKSLIHGLERLNIVGMESNADFINTIEINFNRKNINSRLKKISKNCVLGFCQSLNGKYNCNKKYFEIPNEIMLFIFVSICADDV